MDQHGGMENKEKVPSSDCEDENESEGLRMMMFVILNLIRL